MPRRSEPTTRTCIVTRLSRPSDELIRFVLDPDRRVVADLRHRLPGRGVWVTARASSLAEAERKRLFSRAFKDDVIVEPGLADRVGRQLRDAVLGALALSRKAGELVAGFAKVEAATAAGKAVALLHAPGAGDDGVRKIEAAVRRRGNAAYRPQVIRDLTAEEMGLAMGGAHVIHAALLAGRASDNVLDQLAALARYYDREAPDAVAISPVPYADSTMTAGHS